jgi:hypothetical protein
VQRRIIRVRVIMAAANCSPAVSIRRAKYVDDFRIPTLLGYRVHSQDRTLFLKPQTRNFFLDGCSRLDSAVREGRAAHMFLF